MGQGPIRVTPNDLIGLANALRAGQRQIEEILNQLRGQTEQTESMWAGAAAQAFAEDMMQWQSDSQRLFELLFRIADQLTTAANNYEQAEQGIAHGFDNQGYGPH